jgi:peptidoglycan hydrolase-like protein with peptidoglycan-binding domain
MTPGESGPDVSELQKALASLGYYTGGDTGCFGTATEGAVALYYEHLGYTPPSTGGVPLTDVLFLPSLPARVIAVNGARGQQPGQPFLELAARGSLALTGELPPAYSGQVKPGLKVKIFDEVTGIHATGTISDVGTPRTCSWLDTSWVFRSLRDRQAKRWARTYTPRARSRQASMARATSRPVGGGRRITGPVLVRARRMRSGWLPPRWPRVSLLSVE